MGFLLTSTWRLITAWVRASCRILRTKWEDSKTKINNVSSKTTTLHLLKAGFWTTTWAVRVLVAISHSETCTPRSIMANILKSVMASEQKRLHFSIWRMSKMKTSSRSFPERTSWCGTLLTIKTWLLITFKPRSRKNCRSNLKIYCRFSSEGSNSALTKPWQTVLLCGSTDQTAPTPTNSSFWKTTLANPKTAFIQWCTWLQDTSSNNWSNWNANPKHRRKAWF